MGFELKNGSVEFDPKSDAAQSTGDPKNATKAMEEALHFDFNSTPIMDFLNNESIFGGSDVSKLIEIVIPQVYSTSLATGIERQTSLDMGEHEGYEASYNVGGWGEPDSMEQIDLVPKIKANQTRYVDKASYVDNGVYLSASAKVISQVHK